MATTKIGASQMDKPAPLWYRRLSNAMIIFLLPALVVLAQGWGFSDKILNKILLMLSFAPAGIKAIGVMLGNGQVYAPSNDAVDNSQPAADVPASPSTKQ